MYEVVMPFEPEWGKIVNGRWTGVLGMVKRNEVDFGISNLMITEDRYESFMLSIPYNSDGWNLISLAPQVYENRQAVVQPFKREVWFTLFMSVLISTCLLFTMQTLRSRFKWTPHLSWRNSLWNVVAALCQEGVKMKRMRGAVVVYFLFWLFSAMILQASYGGTLIGFLTFPSYEPSISTLQELARAVLEKDVKITYKKYSLAEDLLKNHERYGNFFTKTINSQLLGPVSNHVEGYERVLKDNFVFVANEFGCVYDSFSVDFTKLKMSTVFGRNYVSVAVSSKFKYLKDFNAVLRRLPEQGLIRKWRSDILTRRLMEKMFHKKDNENTNVETSKSKPLKIGHLWGAFLLLIIGHSLGTIILISEICYKRRMQPRRKLRWYSQKWNRYY